MACRVTDWRCACSEVEVKLEADAVAVGTGMVTVSQSPHVVDAQHSEDVVESDTCFNIGFA